MELEDAPDHLYVLLLGGVAGRVVGGPAAPEPGWLLALPLLPYSDSPPLAGAQDVE